MVIKNSSIKQALLTLFISLFITILVSYFTCQETKKKLENEFSILCNELTLNIENRIILHAQILQNTSSFISSSDTITKKEWSSFIRNSKIDKNTPGFQGIGYNVLVPKDQLETHSKIFKNVYKNYSIKPNYERAVYTSLIYLEPLNDKNIKVIGYDTYAEPIRREAMQIARDNDLPVLTKKLMLVQEGKANKQAGVIMYVPVYSPNMPKTTLKERQKAIKGWVSSSYRMNDLMDNVLGKWINDTKKQFSLQVFEGNNIDDSNVLYVSDIVPTTSNFLYNKETLKIPLNLYGRTWSLVFSHQIINQYFTASFLFVLFSGITISVLLSFLVYAFLNTKYKAKKIAAGLTKTLLIKNKELQISKEKAEESDRLKSAFLANMSHEIRTPMNGILGFSNLLSEPGLKREKQQAYIKIIQKSGDRMLNIISEIVQISKIESGAVDLHIKLVDVDKKLTSVYELFKPDAQTKSINLSLKSCLQLTKPILKTDEGKLESILTNLIKNAIKYTDKGFVEFGYNPKEIEGKNFLEFYVKDTGIGIKADRQKVVFDRFIQADIEDIEARQGAGLGLAIVKSYVEILKGKVWVESEIGIGSTFYFTLPYITELKEKIGD